MSKKVNLVSI